MENRRKGCASLVMLTSYELWNERKTRVYELVMDAQCYLANHKRVSQPKGFTGAESLSSIMT
jgi:hypothetical protein